MIPHVPRLGFGPSVGCMVIRMEKQAFPAAWLHIHTASSRGTRRAGRGAAFPTSDFRLLLIAPHPFAGSADGSGPSALSACAVRILDVHEYACGVAALPFAHLAHSRRNAAFTTPGGAPKAPMRTAGGQGRYAFEGHLPAASVAADGNRPTRPPPAGRYNGPSRAVFKPKIRISPPILPSSLFSPATKAPHLPPFKSQIPIPQ